MTAAYAWRGGGHEREVSPCGRGSGQARAEKKALGAAIAARRKAAGLTQEALAGLAGTAKGYLGAIERGHDRPSPAALGRIAAALRTTTGDLLNPAAPVAPDGAAVRRDGVPAPPSGDVPRHRPAAAAAPVAAAAGPKTPGATVRGIPCGAPGTSRAAAAMSEDDLEGGMRRILKDLGLRLAYHPWKLHAKRAKSGFPDWTITGPGGLIFRELKKQQEKPTKAQQEWLDALTAAGADAGVWRPSDLLSGRVARELAALAGLRVAPGGDGG